MALKTESMNFLAQVLHIVTWQCKLHIIYCKTEHKLHFHFLQKQIMKSLMQKLTFKLTLI
jgi:hypothetical protein